ncbi:MAG: L-threonylcarbamoyladenylate synthase [Aquificaceae bacterium]
MRVLELSKESISRAVEVLNSGGIVCFPTDTVYGLLTPALCKECVRRLYGLRRPSGRPFLVLLPDSSWLSEFGIFPSRFHLRLLQEPGLTLIFQKRGCKYGYISKKTIAVRIPSKSSEVYGLLKEFGEPLIAPSANPEGQKTATDIKEAIDYFKSSIELYVDGGSRKGSASTIVRVIGLYGLKVLREGALSKERLMEVYKGFIKKRPFGI